MITGFRSADTERLFAGQRVKRFANIERAALIKLTLLDAAASLAMLRVPPSNSLESLKGDRQGQFSIRINDQWRLCFKWSDGNASDVEIVDYH